MSDLLTTVLNAHGGLHRWNQLRSFTGHMSGGGPVFDRVRQPGAIDDVEFAGATSKRSASGQSVNRGCDPRFFRIRLH